MNEHKLRRAVLAILAVALLAGCTLTDGPQGGSSGPGLGDQSAECTAANSNGVGSADGTATTAEVLKAVKAAECVSVLPESVLASLTNSDEARPQKAFTECVPEVNALDCEYGDPNGTKLMVMYGDSRANMWAPALEILAAQSGWKLRVFSAGGCPVPDLSFRSLETNTPNIGCDQSHAGIPTVIKNLRPDLIIVTSLNFVPLVDGNEPTPEQWQAGWESALSHLAQPGTKLAMIGSTPWWDHGDSRCLAANSRSVQKCSSSPADAHTENSSERAAAATAGALYVDTVPWVCATSCQPVIANTRVYGEGHHFTLSYVVYLTGVLGEALQPALA